MSTEIDRRVVEMQFDNKDFERNVQTSLTTIEKLKMALNFDGAKGLDSITKAADKVDMSNIVTQTQKVQASFSALQVAGATMVMELTKSFMNFGKNLWDNSIGQIKTGGMARALKIEQADFKMKALVEKMDRFKDDSEGAAKYIKEMGNSINWAVDGTAYGYDSAASVAAQLMASGLNDVEQMAKDLRAVAGAASMTGRSYDDMGRIFAAVAGQGKLMGDQLLQFSTGGINAAATIADYLHKTEGEVRQMVSKGQIDFRTFADAMSEAYSKSAGEADKTFSGVTSNVRAQLSRIGQLFAEPYIKNMIPLLQKVKAALKQLRSALVPTAERFDDIFSRLTAYGSAILESMDFSRLDTIIRGIENLAWGVAGVIYTIRQAFRETFDVKTKDDLMEAARQFEAFTEAILPTAEALEGIKTLVKAPLLILKALVSVLSSLKSVFRPVLVSIFKILDAVVSLARHFEPLLNSISKVISESKIIETIIEIIANLIVFLCQQLESLVSVVDVLIEKAIESGHIQRFGNMVKEIGQIISAVIIVSLQLLAAVVMKLLSLINPNDILNFIETFKKNFGFLINFMLAGVDTFVNLIHGFLNSKTLVANFINLMKELVGIIKDLFTGNNVEDRISNIKLVLEDLRTGFSKLVDDLKTQMKEINAGRLILFAFAIGMIFLIFNINKLVEAMTKFTSAATSTVSIGKNLSDALGGMAKAAAPVQVILAFAIAIGAVTSALVTLSQDTDPTRLKNAAIVLGSFALGIVAAAVAVTVAEKKLKTSGNISAVAANLLAIAGSLLMLTFAVKSLSKITTELSGLTAVAGTIGILLLSLSGSVALLSKLAPKFEASMWSLLGFSVGVFLVVKALQALTAYDIESIWRQTLLLGGLMVALGLAIGLTGKAAGVYEKHEKDIKKRSGTGFTLLAFAVSMKVLLTVLNDLCNIPTETLEHGLENIKNILLSFIPLIVVLGVSSRIAGKQSNMIGDSASMFTSLTGMLLVLFGAVAMYGKLMKPEELQQGVDALGKMISIVGNLIAKITAIPMITNTLLTIIPHGDVESMESLFTGISKIIWSVTGLIVTVGLLVNMTKDVSDDDITHVKDLLTTIGLMVVAIEVASIATKDAKAGAILAAMTTIIAVVGAAAFLVAIVSGGGTTIDNIDSVCHDLAFVLAGLGVLFIGLGQLEKNSKKATSTTGSKNSSNTVILMGMLMGVLAEILAFVYITKDMDVDQIRDTFNGVALAFAAMAILVLVLSKIDIRRFGKFNNITNPLLQLLFGLSLIMASFSVLALAVNHSSDNIGTALGIFVLICLAFVELLMHVDDIVAKIDDDLEWGSILKLTAIMGMLAIVVAGIGLVITAIGKAKFEGSLGVIITKFATLAVILGIMGFLIHMVVDEIDFGNGEDKAVWKNLLALGASMAAMSASIYAIAKAMEVVSQINITKDTGWQGIVALLVGFGLVVGAFILLTKFTKDLESGKALALAGSIAMMNISLLAIAGSMKILSDIPADNLTKIRNTMLAFIAIFALISALFGLAAGIPMIGTGIQIFSKLLLSLSITMVAMAVSIKVFSDVLHSFAEMSTEDIDQLINNIEHFLDKLPTLEQMLADVGPHIAKAMALWINYMALGIGMSAGAIIGAAFTLVISFLAGILMALPAILDAIGIVLQAVSDWLLKDENQTIIKNAFEAIGVTILNALEGVIIGFFEWFGVEMKQLKADLEGWGLENTFDQLWKDYTGDTNYENWVNAYKQALDVMSKYSGKKFEDMSADEQIAYMNMIERFKTLQDDAYQNGWSLTMYEKGTFLGQRDKYTNVGWEGTLNSYAESWIDVVNALGGSQDDINQFYDKMVESGANVEEMFDRIDEKENVLEDHSKILMNLPVFKRFEDSTRSTISDLKVVNNVLGTLTDKAVDFKNEVEENAEQNWVRDWIDDVNEASKNSDEEGKNWVQNFVEGMQDSEKEVGDETDNILNIIGNRITRTSGGSTANNAVQSMVRLNLKPTTTDSIDTKALKDDVKPDARELGETVSNEAGSGFAEYTGKSAKQWVNDAMNTLMPYAEAAGEWLGYDIAGSMKNGMSSSFNEDGSFSGTGFLTGMLGLGSGMTTEQSRKYWSEMVNIYEEVGEEMVVIGTKARWAANDYASLDEAVMQNSHYGKDWFFNMTGLDKTLDKAKETLGDLIPNVDDLTKGLGDLSDAEGYAADYTDKLKDSIESTLDVFSEFNKEVKLTGREILANFYSQIDGVQTWQKELEELASRGMNKNFLNQLAEEGPKAYDRIHAFYNMTEAEMTLFNTMYAQKLMIQRSSQNQIRKTFVATGNMMEDELDKFETSIGEQYDEKLARAQAKAANSKAGTIAESTQKSLDSMYEEIEKYESDTEFIEQWKDNIASSSVKLDLMNAFSQLGYSSIDAFAQSMNFQKVMEKILQFKQTVKEQVKSSLNLFDEVKEVEEKDKMTTTEILNNMEENLKRVGGWSNNLKKMIKMGFSEGLIEELRQMGPESAEKVEAFVKMTAAEVKMANRYWGDSVQLPESISDRLTDEYAKAGFEISLGLKKGLDEGSEDFYEHFRTAGEDASQGYVDGIDSEAANEAMEQLGQNTLDRLMTKLDEHSPSREMMKIGMNAVAGYLIGLKKGIKGLGTFTNELGSKVMDGFTKNISFTDTMSTDINDVLNTMTDKLYNVGNAASMIDMNDIYEPVIRPVWDTTAIENGFTTIDQLLSGKTISLKAVNDAAQRSGPSQDAVMITNAINNLYNEQRIIRGEINSLNSNVSTLGSRIDGMYVRLDGNALVGQIVSPMDKAMGKKVVTQKRGRV